MASIALESPTHVAQSKPLRAGGILLLATTVFLGAWLLFQVQPMVAKSILPWFGGGPAVWATTMLFFQTALLAGYLYAHVLASRLPGAMQFRMHAALLIGAAVLLVVNPAIPTDAWKPADSAMPAVRILVLLAATIGLPYVLLAATAPLVQAWYAGSAGAGSPYRLYALSNLGSLAALFTYPFLVEPAIGIARQGIVWSALFGAFALVCAATGWMLTRDGDKGAREVQRPESLAQSSARPHNEGQPPRLHRFLWLAMPACASTALLAVTNYLSQDVASFPLLWIVPLALYLGTFIATFDSDRWYRRWFWGPALVVASFWSAHAWYEGPYYALSLQLGSHLLLLAAIGMICHGEVARLRPAPRWLTSFYLRIAAGGALGGVFVGLAAPAMFNDRYELPLSILAAWALGMVVLATDRSSPLFDGRKFPAWLGIVVGWIVMAVVARNFYVLGSESRVAKARNFYGVLRVADYKNGPPNLHYRKLTNGRISHGAQYLSEDNRRVPTQYFYQATGVGQALLAMPEGRPRRVGVVGLGSGVIAAYANDGDYYAFYDINPQVIDFADRYFTFLADAHERGATIEVLDGDARLSLERQSPQEFDVLVLDAFSGDAIPIHLVTEEALDLAWSHVARPDGVLAVHVSNLHLDLRPVVNAAAKRHKLQATLVANQQAQGPADQAADWILLHEEPGKFDGSDGAYPLVETMETDWTVEWTDDYSNLLEIMK